MSQEDDVVVQEAVDAVRPILRAQRIAKKKAVDRIVLAFMDSDSDSDDHIDDNDESGDDYIWFEHRDNLYNVQSWILIVVRFESKVWISRDELNSRGNKIFMIRKIFF